MRILIVKLSSIGDVVHAMPAAAALRRAFPDAHLTWTVERIAAPLLVGSPILDEVIVLDTRKWRRSLGSATTWRTAARSARALRRPDLALDFQGLLKSAAIMRLSGATERIGFSTNALREPASRFGYTRQIVVEESEHVILRNLRLALAVGANAPKAYEFPFPPLDDEGVVISHRLESLHIQEFAILNPGGGWVTKLWPATEFAKLADILWERFGLASVVTCGPGEESLARTIVSGARTQRTVFLPTTLLAFIALARRARIFVGGDTGPLHLAAAARTPIVGVYGPTEPARNGPFDLQDCTVGRDIPCRINCHRRTCERHICMEISVEIVTQAVEKRLATAAAPC